MRCMDCPAGKRITAERIMCIEYGMVLLETHECEREGWKEYEQDDRGEGEDETEVQRDGGEAAGSGESLL